MSDQTIPMSSSGPPETIIDTEESDALEALEEALGRPTEERRDAVAGVVIRWPRFLDAWAHLGHLSSDDAGSYAAYRVGYHRGLDRLRQSGWRGAGTVRFVHRTNRGFLRCVAGLQEVAHRIGEADEDERCSVFLLQLDPSWPPADPWER